MTAGEGSSCRQIVVKYSITGIAVVRVILIEEIFKLIKEGRGGGGGGGEE